MRTFAFVSRHEPTDSQHKLAKEQGITLVPIGDLDAFSVAAEDLENYQYCDGVIVVHPAAALRLAKHYLIGVFKNANRSGANEPPRFEAESLHVFDLRDTA
jgi:hypothetical protein